MNYINFSSKNFPILKLKRDISLHLKRGHPWIFEDAIFFEKPATNNFPQLGKLIDKKNQFLAWGIYDSNSQLAFRVIDLDHKIFEQNIIHSKFLNAIEIRQILFGKSLSTNAYRLFNGEGDGLPGLICDIYGDYGVLKLDGQHLEKIWDIESIASFLEQNLSLRGVYFKTKDKDAGKVLFGSVPNEIDFLENNVKFSVNVREGSKTGFFLDQRDNRRFIGQLAHEKRVLNLFSYTGGFSVYAGLGGAKEVTSVDIAPKAVSLAQTHWEKNNLQTQNHYSVSSDAFEFVEKMAQEKRMWDLIIVDPPSFAPSAQTLKEGIKAYQKIFLLSLKLLAANGTIAFSSCSSHVDFSTFLEICREAFSLARKRAQVIYISGQGADHPFPLIAPELRYLKFAVLRQF